MTTSAPEAISEQPDTTHQFLDGETIPQYEARHDAIRAAKAYHDGWTAAVKAMLEETDAAPRTRQRAWGLLIDRIMERTENAVASYRAREYRWYMKWADERAARDSSR